MDAECAEPETLLGDSQLRTKNVVVDCTLERMPKPPAILACSALSCSSDRNTDGALLESRPSIWGPLGDSDYADSRPATESSLH